MRCFKRSPSLTLVIAFTCSVVFPILALTWKQQNKIHSSTRQVSQTNISLLTAQAREWHFKLVIVDIVLLTLWLNHYKYHWTLSVWKADLNIMCGFRYLKLFAKAKTTRRIKLRSFYLFIYFLPIWPGYFSNVSLNKLIIWVESFQCSFETK